MQFYVKLSRVNGITFDLHVKHYDELETSLKHSTDTLKRLVQTHRHSTYLLRSVSILAFQLRLGLSLGLLPSNVYVLPPGVLRVTVSHHYLPSSTVQKSTGYVAPNVSVFDASYFPYILLSYSRTPLVYALTGKEKTARF
jgi:hypothetical protein